MGTEYKSENLKTSIGQLDSLAHKISMEHRQLERENKKLLERVEAKDKEYSLTHSKDILFGAENLVGRKITSVDSMRDNWYSDYNFILFKCEDGQRIVVSGLVHSQRGINATKIVEEKDNTFFTKEEIESAEERVKTERERREQSDLASKQRELERLQKELKGKEGI